MDWVAVGDPHVERQRAKWVLRHEGYDPVSGRRRVRQLGTFETKREAVARQRALLDGKAGTSSETVGEYLERAWLPSKSGRVATATYDQYEWAVRRHIVPLIGAVRLRDLDAEVVDRWIGVLCAAGLGGRPRLGPTSARLVRKVLSMASEEAVQRGRLHANPVPLTQPPRRDRTAKKLAWTLDEARTFLTSVAKHRLYAAFHLNLMTGLRRGEILALAWDNVDLKERQLDVVQQLALERGRPALKALKTQASERVVTFGPATAAVLERHGSVRRPSGTSSARRGGSLVWCSRPTWAAGSIPTTFAD